jgi:hypothetical protein
VRLWPTAAAALALGCGAAVAAATTGAAPPTLKQCQSVRASRERPAVLALDPKRRAPRIFAIQYKQDVANVTTYAAFRTKIECVIREDVLPYLARGRPNVVVFNEATGLMTLATGSRGATARNDIAHRGGPSCESQGAPCATLAALAAVSAAYSPQIAYYDARFGAMGLPGTWVAATDTLVRAFMETFSGLALKYGIYLIASTYQAPFKVSTSASDIAVLHDPDYPAPPYVYVATSPNVYDVVFMWGPHDVHTTGPVPLRNVVASNLKIPLTPLEQEIGFSTGPDSGPAAVANLKPYQLPGTRARLGFATSAPAFVYGTPAKGVDPCSSVSSYYMRCLDKLGANIVIQDEANDGRWTGTDANPAEQWQPLSWMVSTYRAVSDPTVRFDYNVTAMMTGNLADLVFDGQTAITQRGLHGRGCHYIGDAQFIPSEDLAQYKPYAGNQPDFLAIAPWVTPDAPRSALRQTGTALAPGSGSPLEDDYAETAIVADLPIPVDRHRRDCVTATRPPRHAPGHSRR